MYSVLLTAHASEVFQSAKAHVPARQGTTCAKMEPVCPALPSKRNVMPYQRVWSTAFSF